MKSENIECECCRGGMNFVGTYLKYRHLSCPDCGHERFFCEKDAISSELYEDDADYNADLLVANSHKDLLMWNHVQAIKKIELIFKGGQPRILDVGCFNGFFVKELRDRGFDATGIDFNRKALKFGRLNYELHDKISEKTLADLGRAGDRFDVITMFEVIEHLEDFNSFIQSAALLLNDGGTLIISTPNSKMTWRPDLDYPPHHLSRFSPLSLRRLLERFDLKVLCQKEQMSLFDLLRNYIGSLLRSKSSQSMRGGEFRSPGTANVLRTIANRSKWIIYRISTPLDILLHSIGVRYIGQIIVVQKNCI